MPLDTTGTLLTISDGQTRVPLFAARGLIQTCSPIAAATVVSRSINGDAMDLSSPRFRKYASEITCKDFQSISFDGLWPGMFVWVECTFELSYRTVGGAPSRTPVSGSEWVSGDFTFYRPTMFMQITSGPEFTYDEYGAEYSWKLGLEEAGDQPT